MPKGHCSNLSKDRARAEHVAKTEEVMDAAFIEVECITWDFTKSRNL